MLPLYQLLMVSDNDDVKFALMRLRKYSTQSSMIAIPIVKKYYFFVIFSHFKPSLWVLIKG
jgi:hypothetical protein